jgi:N-carbamoylputrescine amidase
MSLSLGIVQMAVSDVLEDNVAKAIAFVREAAGRGATAVLLPELFEGYYWPQAQRERFFERAHAIEGHPFIGRFQELARQLRVVLPLSFFEKSGHAYYNSLVMLDATGELLGLYRKSHIPDGPGYMEKYYFAPGDTGFKAFPTKSGTLGAAICWDQWYPETARAMALQGAEVLLYPTAIGSEPDAAGPMDTSKMWRRVMVGHAVANACYLGAANRVGTETVEGASQTFYGTSFICDFAGEILAEAGRTEETVLVAALNLDEARSFRAGMGFFRDRRPDLYGPLLTRDGKTQARG